MKDYEIVGDKIIEQIFRQDPGFMVESGVDFGSPKFINPKGTRGGVAFDVKNEVDVWDTILDKELDSNTMKPATYGNKNIDKLEIILTVSDLYLVVIHKGSASMQVKDVYASPPPIGGSPYLSEVLNILFYNKNPQEFLKDKAFYIIEEGLKRFNAFAKEMEK